MQDGPSLGFLDYFFNPACQFVTTVSGGDAAPDALTVFTRNRLPSAVTSEILWRPARPILPTGTARDYVEDDITYRLRYYFQPSAARLGSESTH